MGFILSIIAYTLFWILAPLNFLAILITKAKDRAFFRVTNEFWKQNGIEIDTFANTHYKTLWNNTLRKKDSYEFGSKEETISSVLGRLQISDNLTITGWILVYILYAIDYKYWGKGGHCINSIGK